MPQHQTVLRRPRSPDHPVSPETASTLLETLFDLFAGATGLPGAPATQANEVGQLLSIVLPWARIPRGPLRAVSPPEALMRLEHRPSPGVLDLRGQYGRKVPRNIMAMIDDLPPQALSRIVRRQELDPRQLKTRQDLAWVDDIEEYIRNYPRSFTHQERPLVLDLDDELQLLDGHHRAIASLLLGRPLASDVIEVPRLLRYFHR